MRTVGTDYNVAVVERSIREMKEGTHILERRIPFRSAPRLMSRRIVDVTTRNMTPFPIENGA